MDNCEEVIDNCTGLEMGDLIWGLDIVGRFQPLPDLLPERIVP